MGLRIHLRNIHDISSDVVENVTDGAMKFKKNKGRSFDCIKCDQKFYSRANLEFHEKKIRDEILSCSKCDFKSCTKMGLIIHLRNVHDISSDGAMILDVSEHKRSIQMTSHGRFMVS
jgi:hypothetical protein